MGNAAEIENLNTVFSTLSILPIILNEIDVKNDEAREELNQLIYTHYEGNTLGDIPQCSCGHLTGMFNVNRQCSKCNTVVKPITEREIESLVWIRPIEGVHTLINPQCWTMLSSALTYGALNILEYLCSPTLALPVNQPKEAQRFLQMKIPRGLNYFYQNFDEIIGRLFDNNLVWANKPKRERNIFRQFIAENREKIFCGHLPCPSKLSLIAEKTATSSYAEESMPMIINAILIISSAENSTRPLSLEVRQARTTDAIKKFAEYNQEVQKKDLFKKEGWSRKHLFGTRLHWTFRGVITSLSENHARDELHMPWSMSVMLFEYHLYNKLLARNYTPTEAHTLVYESVLQYNPLIDALFTELINESPFGGIPTLFGRNPTLMRGSIQLFRITRINKDPTINSIALSVLVLRAPNADFDGRLIAVVKLL